MRLPRTPKPTRLHTGGYKFAMGLSRLMLFTPVYLFFFGIVALVIGFSLHPLPAVVFLLFGPPITHFFIERKRFRDFDRAHVMMWNYALLTFKEVDYFWSAWSGAISLDVAAGKIALVHKMVDFKSKARFTVIPLDKIVSCYAHIADKNQIEILGSVSSSLRSDIQWKNLVNLDKAKAETGIYFIVDEVSSKKHFISMPEPMIQVWVRLIDKMKKGELEPQSAPIDTAKL